MPYVVAYDPPAVPMGIFTSTVISTCLPAMPALRSVTILSGGVEYVFAAVNKMVAPPLSAWAEEILILLATGIIFAPLIQSENFMEIFGSLFGSVIWKIYFQPSSHVPFAVDVDLTTVIESTASTPLPGITSPPIPPLSLEP